MKDLLLDSGGNLVIENNDFKIGTSDLQHQEHILIGQKGCLKEFPDRGVGIENFLNGEMIDEMLNMIKIEFEKDGMTVDKLSYNEQTGQLDYNANY